MICLDSSKGRTQKPEPAANHRQLTGRREVIDHVCGTIRSRANQAVFLMAGPGLGKTSLTDAVSENLSAEMTILRIHGSSSLAKVPYGVLAPYTADLPLDEADSPVAVLRAVWAYFQELKAGKDVPLLLVIDDAHHLDEATANMIVDMMSAGWAGVLASGRPRPGLPQALNQLWYDGQAERIDLRPLNGEQVTEVVEHTLHGTVPANTVQSLWSASGGNPLLLNCLLRDAVEAGILAKRNGIWLLLGPLPADGPRLSDVVVKDLLRRTPEEQDALRLIALAEPVDRGLIEDVFGGAVVRSLLDHQLVSESSGRHSQLRIWHAILGEAMRHQVSVSRSLQLRQKMEGHLDPATAGAEGRLRLVEWSLECGMEVSDPDLLDAALLAATMFNNAGARLMAGHVTDPELQARAQSISARALFNEGKYREAAGLLDSCWLELAEVPEAPHVLMLRASAHLALGKSAELLRAESRDQLADAGDDPQASWQDRIHHLLELAEAGDHEGIRTLIASLEGGGGLEAAPGAAASGAVKAKVAERPLVEPLPATVTEATSTVAHALLAQTLVSAGLAHQAHDAALAAAPSMEALQGGLYFFNEFLLTRLVSASLAAGNWESSEHELASPHAEENEGAATFGGGFHVLRGLGFLRQGQLERAYQVLLPAVEALRINDPLQQFRFGTALAFYAAARLGDGAQAQRLEQDLIAARHASGPGSELLAEAYAAAAAEYLDRKGSGLAKLRELAASPRVVAQPGTRMECLILCSDLGDRSVADDIASLADSVEGRWAAGWHQLAHAWASEDADVLMETAAGLEEAGLVNLAREAYARAGAILDAAGERRRARQAVAHREKCDQELGERFRESPFVASVPSVHLTRRERDIVELAVQGLSDREIAQQLMVSVRTVEGHLYRSYVKLGVRRRDELALALPKK
ncbi:LuxR C-terminal-related transcriptional regulator [Arthrobacter pascens]|uniref:LuxR C-terminal-related transcriptional regulator n=1 Tax=Arthrobacter pascens TaxID=1677 RepID=UPI0035B540DF